MVWDAVWHPWGGAHTLTGAEALTARFPGQWFQLEAGLHYNWHRHYDPSLGRYTQPDPLGFVDGPGIYAYAGGNSVTYVDKDGRFWNLILGGGVGVAEGYLLAWATGDCYELGDAVRDFALGAAGAGLFAKFEKLAELNKLRRLAGDRGLQPSKMTKFIEDYRHPSTLERLTIKFTGSINATGALSQHPRVSYRIVAGQYMNPLTGEFGKAVELSHVPIGIPSWAGAVRGGSASIAGHTSCNCQR